MDEYFNARQTDLAEIPCEDVWNIIHRCCMPELVLNDDYDWRLFFGAYVKTYIERDVRPSVLYCFAMESSDFDD
ncbi:MAG: hypothetical protein LBU32_18915 [Clostridiales bacterium]|jgi:hypothetical protein|nr:hypothetical protein [Clostridiales bacterium]